MTVKRELAGPSWKRESSVAVLNGLNIVGALASQLLVFRVVGLSSPTDAYVAAAAFPQIALSVIAVCASGVVVPMLAAQEPAEQDRTLGTLIAAALAVLVPGSAIAVATANEWVPVLFPGLAKSVPKLVVDLVQVQLFAVPLMAVSMLLAARWQARQGFVRTESTNLLLTVLALAALVVLLPRAGVMAAAWIVVVRQALLVLALGAGVRWSSLAGSWAVLRAAWFRSRLLLAGNLYFKSDLLVDRYLLSSGAVGSLALFSLAQTMVSSLAGVIGQAWGNTAVPTMAAAHARGDGAAILAVLRRNLRWIALACAVALPLFVVGLPPALAAVTNRSLAAEDGSRLWMLLLLLWGVPLFGAIGALVSGCFYACSDTSTPTLVSIITFTVFVAAKVWVFNAFGLYAFCALTTIYYAINAGVLGLTLRHRLFPLPAKP